MVRELRSRLGAEREAFLRERLGDVSHLAPEDQQRIAQLMDELLNRVLFAPAEQLKAIPDLRRKIQSLEALRDLFRLDQGKP